MYYSGKRLTKIADLMFSLYIRKRDERNSCISCGKKWSHDFQCGHFVSRKHFPTRWDRKNAHGQCPSCNSQHIGGGMIWQHGKAINEKYGLGTADTLTNLNYQVTHSIKISFIVRDYWGLVNLGVNPEFISEYFKKALGAKGFDITKYLDYEHLPSKENPKV